MYCVVKFLSNTVCQEAIEYTIDKKNVTHYKITTFNVAVLVICCNTLQDTTFILLFYTKNAGKMYIVAC